MTSRHRLPDTEVDSLVAEWSGDPRSFLIRAVAPAGGPPALRVLENMTTLFDVEDLALLAGGVVDGATRATDAGGYAVQGDEAVVWDGGQNEVLVSRAALSRLMERLAAGALRHRPADPVIDAEWWAELAGLADQDDSGAAL